MHIFCFLASKFLSNFIIIIIISSSSSSIILIY
jgi:hypothetical protein